MQSAEELAHTLDALEYSESIFEHSVKYTLIFNSPRQLNRAIQVLQQKGYPAHRSSKLNPKDGLYELSIVMKLSGPKPDNNDKDLLRVGVVGSRDSQQTHTDSRFAKSTPDMIRDVPIGFYHIKPNPLGDVVVLYNIWGELERVVLPPNSVREKIIELREMELRNIDEHPIPRRKDGSKQKLDNLADDSWLEKAMV